MALLVVAAAAWAEPGSVQVSLGTEYGFTRPKAQQLATTLELSRQIAPRVSVGLSGRVHGRVLSQWDEPLRMAGYYGTSLDQPYIERNAWSAKVEWHPLQGELGLVELRASIHGGLGARRLHSADYWHRLHPARAPTWPGLTADLVDGVGPGLPDLEPSRT